MRIACDSDQTTKRYGAYACKNSDIVHPAHSSLDLCWQGLRNECPNSGIFYQSMQEALFFVERLIHRNPEFASSKKVAQEREEIHVSLKFRAIW